MIIEFIGAPGAGKTTLLPTVIEYLQEQGVPAFTVVEAARPFAQRTSIGKLISTLTPAWLHRPLLWRVFYYQSVWRRRQFRQRYSQLMQHVLESQINRPKEADVRQRRVLYWFNHLAGYYSFLQANARPGEALVLDEGFVHRVVQLFSSSVEVPNKEQIVTYLNLVPRPNLVIFAQTPRDICEKRIYSRGLWDHVKHRAGAEIAQFVANSHLAVCLAVDHMRQQGWTIITVDNGRDDLLTTQAELRHQLTKVASFSSPTIPLQVV